jgi:hypothetical protein
VTAAIDPFCSTVEDSRFKGSSHAFSISNIRDVGEFCIGRRLGCPSDCLWRDAGRRPAGVCSEWSEYSINGSNQALSDKAIQLSIQQKVNHLVVLKLSAAKPIDDGKSIRVEFEINTENGIAIDESNYVLNVALTRDKETMKVARGENGGQELSHVWIVYSLQTLPLKSVGTIEIDGTLVRRDRTRVVAFVQSAKSKEISGAAVLEL